MSEFAALIALMGLCFCIGFGLCCYIIHSKVSSGYLEKIAKEALDRENLEAEL